MELEYISDKNVVKREKSLITGCELEEIYTLRKFPIHMMKNNDNEECCDMIFSIGKEDGFIQLKRIISPQYLYIDTHSNAIGQTWKQSREVLNKLIHENCFENCALLEIGGGTGKLNAEYNAVYDKKIDWEIIEPEPCPEDKCKARYIKGFFPKDVPNKKYDIVIHSHCIEHMEDIGSFFFEVSKLLDIGGRMIFSLPDMEKLIDNGTTSVMNFEHSFLLTSKYIQYFLDKTGFEIEEILHWGNGHSLLYNTKYTGQAKTVSEQELVYLYQENKTKMINYFKNQEDLVASWNERIKKEKRDIYLFGAHISSQFYKSYGLKVARIKGILDNDKYKIGKKISGFDQEIESPNTLKKLESIVVILPPSPYRAEIERQLMQINASIEVW